jgi:hypothetical protein
VFPDRGPQAPVAVPVGTRRDAEGRFTARLTARCCAHRALVAMREHGCWRLSLAWVRNRSWQFDLLPTAYFGLGSGCQRTHFYRRIRCQASFIAVLVGATSCLAATRALAVDDQGNVYAVSASYRWKQEWMDARRRVRSAWQEGQASYLVRPPTSVCVVTHADACRTSLSAGEFVVAGASAQIVTREAMLGLIAPHRA